MKKTLLSVILLFAMVLGGFAQTGGGSAFSFLNLTSSARVASMGGSFLAIADNDLSLALTNPSVISPAMHNHLSLGFVDYYSDVNYGFAAYSRTLPALGSFTGAIQYLNYGKFRYADETGVTSGNFYAGDYAFSLGWGRQLDSSFSIGANARFIYSSLESYTATGLAVDVAGTYTDRKSGFTASLIASNAGTQITTYDGTYEKLPFQLAVGISQKLKHLPFRYSILYQHIEKYDLTYSDPNNPEPKIDPLTNEPIPEKKFNKMADKFMRHIVIGGEFQPTKNFSLRIGYNYGRRQEMKVDTKLSTVGFSWGLGLKISKFQFSYTRSRYHLVGSPNFITISTNLSDFFSSGR